MQNRSLNNKLKSIINELVILAQNEKNIAITSLDEVKVIEANSAMRTYVSVIELLQNEIVKVNG